MYDSGGKPKYQDKNKYRENHEKLFANSWPCKVCGNDRTQGHNLDCPEHWRNK
jgi:hypothetical protein